MQAKFHFKQKSSLLDEKINIEITGLPENQLVNLRAKMTDNLGISWRSRASFKSDAEGNISLKSSKPLSSTYEEPDPMGLFWSMLPCSETPKGEASPLAPLETQLELSLDEDILDTTSIVRRTISPHIKRKDLREDGLVGTFFYHEENEARPTIIVLGGSEGGLRHSNAALLASHGFNSLALAYFATENLAKKLVQIPLEYIEKAIHWLENQSQVDPKNLGMIGTSKGGELALISASLFPSIKALVGYTPSGVVYPGLGASPVQSSWQYKGKEIPFAYGKIPQEVRGKVSKAMQEGQAISWRDTYFYWAKGEDQAEIKLENSQAAILLVSGGKDEIWPADLLCERMISRLKRHNYPHYFHHAFYPEAGHSFTVPGLPTTKSHIAPYAGGLLSLGGKPRDTAHAQFDAWYKTVDFFKEHLNN